MKKSLKLLAILATSFTAISMAHADPQMATYTLSCGNDVVFLHPTGQIPSNGYGVNASISASPGPILKTITGGIDFTENAVASMIHQQSEEMVGTVLRLRYLDDQFDVVVSAPGASVPSMDQIITSMNNRQPVMAAVSATFYSGPPSPTTNIGAVGTCLLQNQ